MKRPYHALVKGRGRTSGNVSQVKAHLSEYLRVVRKGRVVTVTDRDRPIAKIVPHREETVSLRIWKSLEPPGRLADLFSLPPVKGKRATHSLSILLEDRRKR